MKAGCNKLLRFEYGLSCLQTASEEVQFPNLKSFLCYFGRIDSSIVTVPPSLTCTVRFDC